jgi:polysaccharide biosynthesis transport protein
MSENKNLPTPVDPNANVPGAWYGASSPSVSDGDEQGGPGISPSRIMAAALRYKWIVLLLTVVGATGAWFASQRAELVYSAQATVMLDLVARADQARGPIQTSELLRGEDWLSLFRSFQVLDHVVERERLYVKHAVRDLDIMRTFRAETGFQPGRYALRVSKQGNRAELFAYEDESTETFSPGEPVGARFGFSWTPSPAALRPGRTIEFTLVSPREAATELRTALGARIPRNSNFIAVTYQHANPQTAARVVNAAIEQFVEMGGTLKTAKVLELRNILEDQLRIAEANLAQADQALQSYRVATITQPSEHSPVAPGLVETQGPVTSAFWSMTLERDANQRDRQLILQAIEKGVADPVSIDALSTVASVQQSPELSQALVELAAARAELRTLLQEYMPEHPLVRTAEEHVRMLESVAVPQLAQRVVSNIDARTEHFNSRIASAGSEMRAIPVRFAEEWKLRREQAAAERMYTDIRQRFEGTRLAAESTTSDLQILDRAVVPFEPTNDPRTKLLLAGIGGSLALGLLLAIVLDRVDPRLRYAEQVTREMGLNVMGAVPNLAATGRGGLLPAPDSTSVVVEALRAIRLGVTHAYGNAGPIIVTISSPGSGDGKTFITSNLALTYAELGMRTLVIDGDTRRGNLHQIFDHDRKPGLLDYLEGSIEATALIRGTRYERLDIITGGSRRSNAPELLSSPRMGELLGRIKPHYDVILIDSPPLGAGVDPLVLGTLAGHMLLVMRTGNTELKLASQKMELLNRLPIRMLGTILNGFDSQEGYRYYSYLPGYETSEEPRELAPV